MNEPAYSYSPGGALAVCGARVAALIDLPPDAGLVPGLYDLVGDSGAGLDEVLELLVSPGLRAVEHFALAEYTDEGLRTVVRGRYRTQAGGHTVEGRGLWADRILEADGYLLLDPDAPDAAVLPLTTGGVVLAGCLHRLGHSAAGRAEAPAIHAPSEPPPIQAPSESPGNLAAAQSFAVPAPAAVASSARSVVRPDAPTTVESHGASAASGDAGIPSSAPGPGHTMPMPFTNAFDDLSAPPASPAERPSFGRLVLSNGDTVVLDRGCILGRNPRVPSGYSGEPPNLVKLIDPDKDISGQHLEVRPENGRVAVRDLGSTNGTQVVPQGGHPVALRPKHPVAIEPGTTVILAGVFSLTYEVTDGP